VVAAHRLGLELHILHASNERDFNSVFPKLTEARAGGLVIGADVLFTSHVQQIAALTRQHATPAAAWTRLSYPTALSPRIASAGLRYTKRIAALVVVPDALFVGQREQLAALAARHAMPTIYSNRLYADAGGLMSYGASQFDAYRQAGVYVGRILSGANPADLPSAD